jgi:aminoglycoside 6-adenylyltransferase
VIEGLLAAVQAWAAERPDVGAVLLVGSQARSDLPADELSDVDLVLVVDDPAPYLASAEWTAAFGEPLATFVEDTLPGVRERRVLYRDGRDVDFNFVSREAAPGAIAAVAGVLGRGHRVLVDRIGLDLPAGPAPPEPLPGEAEFAELVHEFWYQAVWASRKLRRGELWVASRGIDSGLGWLLGRMLAWHARALDPGRDTWHEGRFLERWADTDAVASLPATRGGYDAAAAARALAAACDLFTRLTAETAERLGFAPPVDEERLRELAVGKRPHVATLSSAEGLEGRPPAS